jgi:capsular polysaccharide biosynthesis protein
MSNNPQSLDIATHYLNSGRFYQQNQSLYSAIVSYEKSLQLNPNQADTWHELGLLYCHFERYQEGIICYLESLFLEINPEVCQSLSKALFNISKISQAEEAAANIISNRLITDFYPLSPETEQQIYQLSNLDQQLNQSNYQSNHQLNQQLDSLGHLDRQFDSPCSQQPKQKIYYQHIYNSDRLDLTPANPLDYDHPYFIREKVDYPAATVTTVQGGKVIARDWASVITTADNDFLPEISTGLSLWLFLLKEQPPLEKVPGRVVALARWAGLKYFHWLGETFSTIHLLNLAGIELGAIDYFLVNSPFPDYQKAMLETLGIHPQQILTTDDYPYLQAEELIIPYYGNVDGWFPKIAIDFLRDKFLPIVNLNSYTSINSSPLPKKIYLSRAAVSYRRVVNEAELQEFLSDRGFVTIRPESLSFLEQVALFAQAETIIAPHGAGLANLAFCQPRTQVVELFTPDYVYGCFWAIASQRDLDYCYLVDSGIDRDPPRLDDLMHPCYRDIYVDISRLQKFLS